MRGGDAQVKQEAGQVGHAGTVQYGPKVHEGGPVQLHPVTEWGQPGGAGHQRLVIAVNPEDPEVAPHCQHGFGVTSTAYRGVQYDTGRHVGQSFQDLGHHDRPMLEVGGPLPVVLAASFHHRSVRRSVDLDEAGPGGPSLDRPPICWRTSGCLPESGWMASGRSRGLPSCGPGDGPGTNRSVTGRRGLWLSWCVLPLDPNSVG